MGRIGKNSAAQMYRPDSPYYRGLWFGYVTIVLGEQN